MAEDAPPSVVREPVFGLRFDIAKAQFEALPAEVLAHYSTMDNENIRGHYWVCASTRNPTRAYYVIGGYGVRSHPEPPDFPRYVPYDDGAVIVVEDNHCADLGSARDVFDAGAFGTDMPAAILRQLAADLASRLVRALGGADPMHLALKKQHVDPQHLSPELRAALTPYLAR